MSVSTEGNFSDIKTPVTPEWRPYSVPTAFYKIAERRGARCAVTSNAVCALCNGLEHHAAGVCFEHAQNKRRGLAFAQCVRQRAAGTLLERCGVF